MFRMVVAGTLFLLVACGEEMLAPASEDSCFAGYEGKTVFGRDSMWIFDRNDILLETRPIALASMTLVSQSVIICGYSSSGQPLYHYVLDADGGMVGYSYCRDGVQYRWNDSLPEGIELMHGTKQLGAISFEFSSYWTGADTVLETRASYVVGKVRVVRSTTAAGDVSTKAYYASEALDELEKKTVFDHWAGRYTRITLYNDGAPSVEYNCAQ